MNMTNTNAITKNVNVDFKVDNVEFQDSFLVMNVLIGDNRDDISEAEMSVPVEDLGDGEWCADECDAESQELEDIAAKLGIDCRQLLVALTRTGFEAWEAEGFPTDYVVTSGCAVDVPVAADLVKTWKDAALVAA